MNHYLQYYYIIYLRKSRQDNPSESVVEVLAKHERILQDYARAEFGFEIPEKYIYREIVSSETIDDREQMLAVLQEVENPLCMGILVVDPQRLSRGDLLDCGRLVSHLRFSNTKVYTPMMTYDLTNKMERKFFQDELLRGADYLDYTKEILMRGRIAATKRGCFIGNIPPFGFNKVIVNGNRTLEENEDADIVRMIFDWYVKEQRSPNQISNQLNDMGIPSPKKKKWTKETVRAILRNRHYIGKVVFGQSKEHTFVENGEKIKKRLKQKEEDIVIAEGLHDGFINLEIWEAAQALIQRNPPRKDGVQATNPLAGIIKCGVCGKAMFIHSYPKAENRYECRTRPACQKSIKASTLLDAVSTALIESKLPELKVKVNNDDGNATRIQEKLVDKLTKELAALHKKDDKQHDLLEDGTYTRELFDRRNGALKKQIEECQTRLHEAKKNLPKAIDYGKKVVALESAISALNDKSAPIEDVNKVLRAILDKITYTGGKVQPNRNRPKERDNAFKLEIFLRL